MMKYSVAFLVFLASTFWVTAAITIHGQWSPWSTLGTECNETCGTGYQMRFRSCTNPAPQGDAPLPCQGKEKQLFPCNTHECGSTWSAWGNCSAECGKGLMTRVTLCGINNVTCTDNQFKEEQKPCNTWNKTTCPSPCIGYSCPKFAMCDDRSTDEEPVAVCVCTMGYVMKNDKSSCIRPPPTTPTPRPIPTLPPAQKVVATVVTKTASTVLIFFVGFTLILFLLLRIFSPDRVIQMNMEIALISAHIVLMMPIDLGVSVCRIFSILVHFFFTAVYMFMFLEALHMYSLVAYVVKKDGMLTRLQNTLVGWGVPAFIILFTMCFEYDNYGGEYHCWLRMDTSLLYAQFIPIVFLVIVTFTIIEAAGAAEYKKLPAQDHKQLVSAKISQRTNLLIMPLVFASWIVGMSSEYEQNLPLYGTFSILNGVLGGVVFFFHSTSNQQVRAKLVKAYKALCKRDKFG